MKCNNCGFDGIGDFRFCPRCGAEARDTVPAVSNPAATRAFALIRDNLFLAVCILMTVSSFFYLMSGGIPVIEVLVTVFLWLTYAKGRRGIVDSRHVRHISGTVYANYVITNVASIIIIVCGVLLICLLGFLSAPYDLVDLIEEKIAGEFTIPVEVPLWMFDIIIWIAGISMVAVGVGCLVFNILGMKKIHRFIKSVYLGVATNTFDVERPRAVRNWLIFFGVCSGVCAICVLMETTSAIAIGCLAASTIIGAVLVNKYFLEVR